MIAANFENLLFLLLIAVAVLFQLLAKAAGKATKDQTNRTPTPRTPPLIPPAPRGSSEEQIRKLLEALGHPPTSTPPPPVVPRTDIPPRPLAPVQPPRSPFSQVRRETLRKRKAILKETPKPPTVTPIEKIVPQKITGVTGAPDFEVHEASSAIAPQIIGTVGGVTQTIAKTDESRIGITKLLGSISDLRDAIILREVLGPPRGLRTLDAIL
jgi:hypothetical protein